MMAYKITCGCNDRLMKNLISVISSCMTELGGVICGSQVEKLDSVMVRPGSQWRQCYKEARKMELGDVIN